MGARGREGPARAVEARVKVHYSEEAEQDLVEIGLYTWTEWGEEQYLEYMALLRDACEDIIPRKRRLARGVPGKPDVRRWRCERHVIFFRQVRDGIEIVRVVHERMLPTRYL